ncbi:hypothetical protein C8J56DRAFT_1044668 [Mycena floridula]|nr:hypothetical protein C8J56DRAFT_1044668 [Mycena floridula]
MDGLAQYPDSDEDHGNNGITADGPADGKPVPIVYSVWPDKPNPTLSPLSAMFTENLPHYKQVYHTDPKTGEQRTTILDPTRVLVPGSDHLKHFSDLNPHLVFFSPAPASWSGRTPAEILAEIPKFEPQPDSDEEKNIHFNPPPPEPMNHELDSVQPETRQNGHVVVENGSAAPTEPNLIPPIATMGDPPAPSSASHVVPDPPWSRDGPFELKSQATWSDSEKGPRLSWQPTVTTRRARTSARRVSSGASASRRGASLDGEGDDEEPIASTSGPVTRKRKSSSDHTFRASPSPWGASLRHLLQDNDEAEGNPDSNIRSSSSRMSAMNIDDDYEESVSAPPVRKAGVPRVIRPAPKASTAIDGPSDDEDSEEFDPDDEEDQLHRGSNSAGGASSKSPKKKRKAGRFKCTVVWCKETFTRRNDVNRHLKNAAVHRNREGAGEDDGDDKRCKFCNADLSRADARVRHERAGACGKRTGPRKTYKLGKGKAAPPDID